MTRKTFFKMETLSKKNFPWYSSNIREVTHAIYVISALWINSVKNTKFSSFVLSFLSSRVETNFLYALHKIIVSPACVSFHKGAYAKVRSRSKVNCSQKTLPWRLSTPRQAGLLKHRHRDNDDRHREANSSGKPKLHTSTYRPIAVELFALAKTESEERYALLYFYLSQERSNANLVVTVIKNMFAASIGIKSLLLCEKHIFAKSQELRQQICYRDTLTEVNTCLLAFLIQEISSNQQFTCSNIHRLEV